MKTLAGFAIVAAALTFSTSAEALQFKCACLASAKAGLQTSVDPKISCVETYSNFSSQVSVQETQLKMYVNADNLVQGDRDVSIKLRPRDQKCLVEVLDGNAGAVRFAGLYCNNDDAKTVSPFQLVETKRGYSAAAAVFTDGAQHTSFLVYSDSRKDKNSSWSKRKLDAVCLQEKGASVATCSCRSSQKAALDTAANISCKSTFSDSASSATVANPAAKLSAYIDSANMSRSDANATPQFKPDSGSCLSYVADSAGKELFKGAYCEGEWKNFGTLAMTQTSESYPAAIQAKTDAKVYKGTVIFAKNMSTLKLEAQAVCLEDR
jgi:hypothetical protein